VIPNHAKRVVDLAPAALQSASAVVTGITCEIPFHVSYHVMLLG